MSILDSMMVALGFQVDDTGLQKFENRAQSVRDSAIGLADVVGGVLTGAFVKLFQSFVDTSAEFEKSAVVLGVLYDNVDQGRQAMNWISDFAVKTPYQLQDLTQAFIRLKAFGLDPMDGTLRTVGDAAAAFGRPLMDAVFAMDDAIEGINRPLRTFGISVKEAGNQVTYSYIKNGKMIAHTADKTNKIMVAQTLNAIWNERYGGAMDKISMTYSGMWSNLLDQITRFKQKVMNSGPFAGVKDVLGKLIDVVNKASSDGTVEKFAKSFDILFQSIYRTFEYLYTGLDFVISKTVGWKVVLSALAFVLTGVLVSALGQTISLVYKLTAAMLGFDLSAIAIFAIAAGLLLLIDDIYNYYKGNKSLIGQLQSEFPHALQMAYGGILLLIGGFVALKWQAIASMTETIGIMGLYAAEWIVTTATTLWGLGAMAVGAAATAVEWVIAFGAMAVATLGATWPILAVIAALALLGFAIYEVWKHWDTITKDMRKAFSFVLDEIKAGITWIESKFGAISDKAFAFVKALPGGDVLIRAATDHGQFNPAAQSSFASNSVNAGGGVIGRAGSNISTTSSSTASTHHTEIHAPITIVSNDPDAAGKSVQRTLDSKRRQTVRNGQSAVAF